MRFFVARALYRPIPTGSAHENLSSSRREQEKIYVVVCMHRGSRNYLPSIPTFKASCKYLAHPRIRYQGTPAAPPSTPVSRPQPPTLEKIYMAFKNIIERFCMGIKSDKKLCVSCPYHQLV